MHSEPGTGRVRARKGCNGASRSESAIEETLIDLFDWFNPLEPVLLDEQENGGGYRASDPISTISFDDGGGYRVPDVDELDFEFM